MTLQSKGSYCRTERDCPFNIVLFHGSICASGKMAVAKKTLLKGNREVETSGSFTKQRHEHVEGGIPVVREWNVRVGKRRVEELSQNANGTLQCVGTLCDSCVACVCKGGGESARHEKRHVW